MDFMALFDFKKMITPVIIKIIYYLGLLGVLLAGLKIMGGGPLGMGVVSIITGLVTIIVGALLVRVWCELLIVLFKINENLQAIRNSKTSV